MEHNSPISSVQFNDFFKVNLPSDFGKFHLVQPPPQITRGPFHHPHNVSNTRGLLIPTAPFSFPRQPVIYLASVDLPFLDILCKWNNTICSFLCLVSFT